MEIFLVSFLVFVCAALLLTLGQWARGEQLPVGCTPDAGQCCRSPDFGKCIEPEGSDRGSFSNEDVRQWTAATERS